MIRDDDKVEKYDFFMHHLNPLGMMVTQRSEKVLSAVVHEYLMQLKGTENTKFQVLDFFVKNF